MKESKKSVKKKAPNQQSNKKAPAKSAKAPAASPRATKAPPSKKKPAQPKEPVAEKESVAQPAPPKPAPTPREPVVDEQLQLPATHGKVVIFGGPRDRGIKPDDKLALPTGPHGVYERVRSLNPKSFYCSMRWNYHVQHLTPDEVKRSWANKRILVTNPKSGSSVVVRAVDYGPHENTGFDIGLSPGAAEALGVDVGDEVNIALAETGSQLGPQ